MKKTNLASKMQKGSKLQEPKGTSRFRYSVKTGKSASGPCAYCRSMAGRHNFAASGEGGVFPPYHPNCKCGMS